MIGIDIKSYVTVAQLLPVAATTSTTNGAAFTVSDYVGNLDVVTSVGAATAGTSPTYDGYFQDSADNVTWANVAADATMTQVTNVASTQSFSLDTRLVRKYLRQVETIGGTNTPSFPRSAVLIGRKQYAG
jgi:hypothetical protein